MLECFDKFYDEIDHRYRTMDVILVIFGDIHRITLLTSTEGELRGSKFNKNL